MSRRPSALALLLGALPLLSCSREPSQPVTGVSWELAESRRAVLTDVRYELRLAIPDSLAERIHGTESISFKLADAIRPLVLDFAAPPGSVIGLRTAEGPVTYERVNDHLVIAARSLNRGENRLEIEFLAGDNSLNRNLEFLYTLFVPDRARFAFPCFDQPDLKGKFRLTLEIPAAWQAVANGELLSHETDDDRATFTFAETEPLSTYLFAFAAGRFEVEEAVRDGRRLRFFHRETDEAKVQRNRDAIFDLHIAALNWLEEYTGIDYPFGKFDFVLIPDFQYSGMEHPGAILYRASRLLLDESATQDQRLGRASLIAHETSHMWFGDLVTMKWFNDVWTKEVFANFMAAKIVHPTFPDIDHDLRFLLAHYPAAYAVDRSQGANPIRQPLDNLRDAGTLYGAIIYMKAPVVMRELEELVGEVELRDGLREYLARYQFANATWPDLIGILDSRTDKDLASWSAVWVEEARRPTVSTARTVDDAAAVTSIVISQSDPAGAGRIWQQQLSVSLGRGSEQRIIPTFLDAASQTLAVDAAAGLPPPDYVLPNGRGVAYGLFLLDDVSQHYLLEHLTEIPQPLTRGIVWVTLWDAMLEERVTPARIIELAERALQVESDELLIQRVLSYLQTAYWKYLTPEARGGRAAEIEALLWAQLEAAEAPGLKAAYLNAYRSMALTEAALSRIEALWRGETEIAGLTISEEDQIRMAQVLALHGVREGPAILDAQRQRITNPDRRARFDFVRPSLSSDPAVRDDFFRSLEQPANREHEPWVLEGLVFLHHPLRARHSEQYILPSLEMLEEIQATGDIFFPARWLDATLGGHNTRNAARIVQDFLARRPDYPPRLKGKILQSADPLFRASRILELQG